MRRKPPLSTITDPRIHASEKKDHLWRAGWGMKRLANSWGQTTLESIAPLLLLLTLLITFALLIPSATPTHVIAFVGAFVVFVLTFISTQIALYILIFSMLLSPEIIIGSTEGGTLGRGITLRVDDLILVVIGFSWLARMSINKELGLFLRTPLNRPIAYYIVVCMISTFLGAIFDRVDLKTGLLYVLKYFEYIIVYFMVVNHLKDSKQAHSYVVAMLLTCAIVSVIGIAKIPTGDRISAPFEGEVGEPNTFGGYLVFMICIVMGLLQAANSFRNQLIYGFLLLLYGIPLFYTQSRSSYFAAVPAVLSFVWLSKKKQWIIPLVLLLGLTLPFVAPRLAKERVAYTFTQGVNRKDTVELFGVKLDTSSSARLLGWQEAARDWSKHPILGFGVTGYHFVDAQYVRTISETGFLGFFFFMLILLTVFKSARRAVADTEDTFHHGLATGFLAGFIGLLFHALGANTFIIVRIMEPFWFLAGTVMMLAEIERAPFTKEGLERPGHPRQQGQPLKE